MSDRSSIDEIKSKLDIVTVIREYVPSLKSSGHNLFALCPFHSEKSPSFSVNESIQRYRCFGCGESGDVISFIQKMEGIDFPRALEIAAKRAGVTIKNFKLNDKDKKKHEEIKKIYEINRLAAEYFHYVLMKHKSGEEGRQYANTRKFGKEQIKEFLIGFAPEGFENLKNFLKTKKYTESVMEKASLIINKNSKSYDKFRKRLMFPIFNHIGDVVGFSGRIIDPGDKPKYLNSSETLVYKKSEIVYGLFQAKNEIRRKNFAILVEGNVDVPTAHKFGIKNIVAPMGTAITEKQLKLIKRYANTIYFAFDSDSAGEKALIRGFEMSENIGIKTKAINLGTYTDIDELLNADPNKADEIIEKAESVVAHLIKRISKRSKLNSALGKSKFVEEIIPILNLVKDEIEQTHYIQQIANIVEVDEKLVRKKLSKSDSGIDKKQGPKIKHKDKMSKEAYAISFLLQFPFLRKNGNIHLNEFENQKLVEVYKQLILKENIQSALNELPENYQQSMSKLLMYNLGEYETDHEIERFFENLIENIEKSIIKSKLTKLRRKIKSEEAIGNDVSELLKELNELRSKL